MTPNTKKRTKQLGLAAAVASVLGLVAGILGVEVPAEVVDQVFSLIAGGTP